MICTVIFKFSLHQKVKIKCLNVVGIIAALVIERGNYKEYRVRYLGEKIYEEWFYEEELEDAETQKPNLNLLANYDE